MFMSKCTFHKTKANRRESQKKIFKTAKMLKQYRGVINILKINSKGLTWAMKK
jgi:hypothetical protein